MPWTQEPRSSMVELLWEYINFNLNLITYVDEALVKRLGGVSFL